MSSSCLAIIHPNKACQTSPSSVVPITTTTSLHRLLQLSRAKAKGVMEGLIPFIYRAVAQYRKEGQVSLADLLFDEQPSSSPTAASAYFRLPGDSGRHQRFSGDSGAAGAARRSPAHRRRSMEHGSW
ncbi:uncharacterized protein [Aegilops tauschii subsp. strangulata]|uniref:Uncharacterized protein n=2 Tax=Triticinae TaxID=1648030 RepID=A0A452Z944_AEGTS|nr:uncharacterized protein LOC109751176 [Aegilops tauschii subsp. strangulata]XP_044444264.1 uncharacterized protein LOC123170459 [Triticum aestivum]